MVKAGEKQNKSKANWSIRLIANKEKSSIQGSVRYTDEKWWKGQYINQIFK